MGKEILTEVEGNVDEDVYQLRPYGMLLLKLGSSDLAQQACDALAAYMTNHKLAIEADERGLHFTPGIDDEEFVILHRATARTGSGCSTTQSVGEPTQREQVISRSARKE